MPTVPSRPTAPSSTTPARRRRWAPAHGTACSTSTRTPTPPGRCCACSASRRRSRYDPHRRGRPSVRGGGGDRSGRRGDHRLRPLDRRGRRRRRLVRRDRRGSGRGGCDGRPAAVQPRHRRCRADGLPVGARARLRPGGAARRRRAARSGRAPQAARADRERRGRRRHRLPVPRGGRRIPSAARATGRDHLVRAARLAPVRSARDRHDVRVPGPQPAGDRALRPRLPERLPGGRGDRASAQASPSARRGACAHARARARLVVDHLRALRLLRGQGDARIVHRDGTPLCGAVGGRRAVTPVRISIAAAIGSALLILIVLELIRGRRLKERYALLWLATGVVLLVLSVWRGGLNTIAAWLGVSGYPPAILFAAAIMFVIAVLLHYSTVLSRLTDDNVLLAQEVALLRARLDALEQAADREATTEPRAG